jgi:hypothetical protein
MSRSRWWIAGAALVVAIALFLSRPTGAQPPAANPPMQGRYQMQVVGQQGAGTVFVLDTHTGHTWYRETRQGVDKWTDMGEPALKEKK